jgi:protein ImuB
MEEFGSVGASSMKEPLYVCVYVPDFAAQALLRLRSNLTETPVVVVAGDAPLEEVCSANDRAFGLGVAQGMTRAELDSFIGLTVFRRSGEEERSAQSALLEMAGTFTPRAEIHTVSASAFVMVLDMTGTSLIFGSALQSLSAIEKALTALRFTGRLAASANFHAAVCIASSLLKAPAIVARGAEATRLSSLPLAALSLSLQQAETMTLWGLRNLGELAALPEVELIARLGQEGKRLRLLARGEHPHLMVPEEPVFALEEFVTFDGPIELMDSLLFVLGPMLDQLLARAQNRSYALASVIVKLGLDGGGEHERSIKPALPVLQREVLLRLIHLDLQTHPPVAGVMSIQLHAEPGDRSKVQLGLFAPQLPEPLRLDVTLARIAALVGEDRVGRAKLRDTHCSDGFVMERFLIPSTPPKETTARQAVALRRYRPPLKLSVRHEDRRLVYFFLQGKRYSVQEAYGPWRRSGEWWSPGVWSREEWDVRATAQADEILLCIIAHDLLNQRWQLEAVYD